LRSSDEASKWGSLRKRQPRFAYAWPLSPAKSSWGGHGVSSSALVARTTQLCCSMSA
jgi:hypothetical protein